MSPVGADSQLGVARSINALRARVDAWRTKGLTIGLVPTMGALHTGHLSLVERSVELADRTVASVFVNPKQFAAHEDLATYPRDEARDFEALRAAGCHLAYAPTPDQMYPEGFQTAVNVESVSRGLCGDSRPHFFGGVATVVCKLLNQCSPDFAVFGEKDFQQLLVIRRMVRDLDMPIEIVGAPIVREADGLAMSSRNAYLTSEERVVAARLNVIIAQMADRLAAGAPVSTTIDDGRSALTEVGLTPIDYLEVRYESDLAQAGPAQLNEALEARVFVAVVLGETRLIDNWPVRTPEPHAARL